MNKLNQLARLFTLLVCISSTTSYAQQIDALEMNGEQFFVYPFPVGVGLHSQYYDALKLSSLNEDLSFDYYQSMMLMEMGEEATKRQYRRFKREMRNYGDDYYDEGGSRRDFKYLKSKKFKKAIRKNPYPLMQQRFQANNDITPMLDPIPDGRYVQFYEEFCMMDSKGHCEMKTQQVAGYFTIKNNLLEGEASWIDLKGDTLKHGWFVNGVKEGEWKFERRWLEYSIDKKQAQLYIDRGYPDLDTLVEYVTYQKGAQNGPTRSYENSAFPIIEGFHKNGEASGTWTYREVAYRGLGSKRHPVRENELITSQFTYESDAELVVHPIWIRKGHARTYDSESDEFNFYSRYSLPELPTRMYQIAFEVEENLELDEEVEGAPYDMDYYEDEYEDEMYYEEEYYAEEYGYEEFRARGYDPVSGKYFPRGKLLDSIGARPLYAGTLETYYDNGQLAYRYTFENGKLLMEDTVFWDNGIAHDVITEVPDSNQFLRSIYDYGGKIYMELLYDSLGDYQRVKKTYQEAQLFKIEGLETYLAAYDKYYFYDAYDTLGKEGMVGPTVLFRSWNAADSSKLFTATYYPDEKRFSTDGYSVTNYEMMHEDKLFADDFGSWTGKRFMRVANLELERTSSGSLHENYTPDSIPIRHIQTPDRFVVANEYLLKKDGNAYTGPVELNFGKKKLKFSKKELTVSLPQQKYTKKKLSKDLKHYRKTGKTKYPLEMNLIDATETESDLSNYIFGEFFVDPLGGFFPLYNGYYSDEEDEFFSKKKDASAQITKVEGYMLDGKPNGLWTGYDQFGKKMIEVPYSKGEANGDVISYDYAFPLEKNEYSWMENDYDNPLRDSFPEKRTYFKSNVTTFLNGKADGKSISYSWYGGITEESNYKEGQLDGRSIERNKLATTIANYKYDAHSGYIRTYLTLRPGDSILLYNLNFQDGLLQGESTAYHINGKLAKRGFFLDGLPIEDYEAYDTLGFKYHYVKFQYSFPIEEKIWEENELSVRYLFKWQDSIHFEPSDITTSQSLEAVISKLGLGGDYFERPYYGRHSLVNKNGIDYQMTKYYPNDTISRIGDLEDGRKAGCWKYYSYNGELLYEVEYKDSIIVINDSIKFKSKGVLTDLDKNGNPLYEAYVIEMSSKYDCAHTDHYEIRQLYTKWEAYDSLNRMNGFVRNFYDNGTLQSEGYMKNGLPDGVWKYFDPYGKLNQYGVYVLGKRDARWLSGDLSKTKYLGDICLNPNLPDLEEEMKYRENLLDIKITNYDLGKSLNTQYYDINMNRFIDDNEEEEEIEE